MLLTEIVATRHKREHDPRGEYEFVPDIEASNKQSSLGSKKIPIYINKEEQNFYQRYNLPQPPSHFQVVYAYTLEKHDTEEARTLLDAIKKRAPLQSGDPSSFMTDENLAAFMKAAVDKLRRGSRGSNAGQAAGKWKQTLAALDQFARWLSNEKERNVIIVPLDSSSSVVSMMANILANETGAPIVDGTFIKQLPHLSKYKTDPKTGETELRTNKAIDYHQKARNLRLDLVRLTRQIDELNNGNYATDKEMKKAIAQIDTLEQKKTKIQTELQDLKFQVKKVDRKSTSGGKWYYNIQKVIPQRAKQLDNAYIILVDDNVDSGLTMSDAIKALYRVGIQPIDILGFCPHNLKVPTKSL